MFLILFWLTIPILFVVSILLIVCLELIMKPSTLNSILPPNATKTCLLPVHYHKADFGLLCDTLCHIPWNCISGSDVEEAWSLWKDMFFSAVNAAVPKIRWKRSKMKYWFSYDTIHLIRLKRRLYTQMIKSPTSDVIRSRYKHISNLVQSRTRKDTEDYISRLSKGYFATPKPFWRWLNSFKGRHAPIPTLLYHDNHACY